MFERCAATWCGDRNGRTWWWKENTWWWKEKRVEGESLFQNLVTSGLRFQCSRVEKKCFYSLTGPDPKHTLSTCTHERTTHANWKKRVYVAHYPWCTEPYKAHRTEIKPPDHQCEMNARLTAHEIMMSFSHCRSTFVFLDQSHGRLVN